MGQHVLSNLQKLKVMNMSCTTSSANVFVGGWLVQARSVRSTSARPANFTETIWSGMQLTCPANILSWKIAFC